MAITNIISVLCEGSHDTAFLSKILKSIGFNSNDGSKLSEYPDPYNQLLVNEAKKSDVQSLNLQELKNVMLPNTTLKYKNNYLFLYAVGGDSRKDRRQKLLIEVNSFIAKSKDEYEILPKETKLTVLYFLDADNKGKDKRLDEVYNEVKEVIEDFTKENPITLFNDKLTIGSFIFTELEKDTGKLEDIILPIMIEDNAEIFDNSKLFIEDHFDSKRVKKNNFNQGKSIISIAGQLQKSGSSNIVCIGQTDYLSLEKILKNEQCSEISEFFKQFLV